MCPTFVWRIWNFAIFSTRPARVSPIRYCVTTVLVLYYLCQVENGMVYYPISDDFDEYDDNDDGLIEYEEFAFDFLSRWQFTRPEQLRVMYKGADTDGKCCDAPSISISFLRVNMRDFSSLLFHSSITFLKDVSRGVTNWIILSAYDQAYAEKERLIAILYVCKSRRFSFIASIPQFCHIKVGF